MKDDPAELARALRRAVFTQRLLSIEEGWRYCDLVGIPRSVLDEHNT